MKKTAAQKRYATLNNYPMYQIAKTDEDRRIADAVYHGYTVLPFITKNGYNFQRASASAIIDYLGSVGITSHHINAAHLCMIFPDSMPMETRWAHLAHCEQISTF